MNTRHYPFHDRRGTVANSATGSDHSRRAPAPAGPSSPGLFSARYSKAPRHRPQLRDLTPRRRHRLHWPDLLKVLVFFLIVFAVAYSGVGSVDL